MRYLLTVIFGILGLQVVLAQKQTIDTNALEKWTTIGPTTISNNGRYATFELQGKLGNNFLCMQGLADSWQQRVPNGSDAYFSSDSKYLVYRKGRDTLCLSRTGKNEIEKIGSVRSFKLCKADNSDILIYAPTQNKNELNIRNLKSGTQRKLTGVSNYLISPDGKSILLTYLKGNNKEIHWIELLTNKTSIIWNGVSLVHPIYHPNSKGVFFMAVNDEAQMVQILEYSRQKNKLILIADSNTLKLTENLVPQGIQKISENGNLLFLSYREKQSEEARNDVVSVDIWSYLDDKPQSVQLRELLTKKSSVAVFNRVTNQIIKIQQKNDLEPISLDDSGDFFVVTNMKGVYSERWNPSAKAVNYVINAKTGERFIAPFHVHGISKDHKFIFGAKVFGGDYFSYELATGIEHNLTSSLHIPLTANDFSLSAPQSKGFQLAVKSTGDLHKIVLYDKFDLWLIDLKNQESAHCITKSFGRKQNTIFRLMHPNNYPEDALDNELFLTAFDLSSMENGFYSVNLHSRANPKKLTMGKYLYRMAGMPDLAQAGMEPLKAENKNIWIVRRESANESPNYFWTSDFKKFQPISHNYPERGYNWLRSKVVAFKTLDGRENQGVLYTPENINPKAKYPVIFYYYTKMARNANCYMLPELPNGDLNIPWFVSRGYAVFTPDILYTIGEPGMSAVSSVVGAANFLASTDPLLDSTRFGLFGHSFGGFETDFIVTHSNKFTAAVSSAGICNLISNYGQLWGRNGSSISEFFEFRDGGIGASLPDRPDLYIKNSPILNVNKIVTPLLLLHNVEDRAVPFSQSVEFFTSLRRSGKKVWLLQYDKEGHSLMKRESKLDFTYRLEGFFDHYLMNRAIPKWMEKQNLATERNSNLIR